MQLIKWDEFFEDRNQSLGKLNWDFATDIFEENGNIIAKLSLPGIKPEETEITLGDNSLTVSGRREEEKEVSKKDYYSKEIRRGSFSRTLQLPKKVDSDKAQAFYEGGVLTITIPVIKNNKDKQVKIKIK